MNVVVQKSEEDFLLSDCDDSCINGKLCVCITDIGTELSGRAMENYGFSSCVLCQRKNGQEYCTLPDLYPVNWVKNNKYIIYNKDNYKLNGKNCIIQYFDASESLYEETWISKIYYTITELINPMSVEWNLTVCENDNCKQPIHAYINVHRAIGISNSYLDVLQNKIMCDICMGELKKIPSVNGIVIFKEGKYAQCRNCFSVIEYNSDAAIQFCTTCVTKCKNDIQKGYHICLYCKNTVNITRNSKVQSFSIRKTPTSRIETVYFCKNHMIYPPNPNKIFKISELLSMF